MLFSNYFKIKINKNIEWFNPILDNDTKLFIDPFLIFKTKNNYFKDAHKKIIAFFNFAFKLASESAGIRTNLSYKKLLNMLLFPEASEINLGYSNYNSFGSGTGKEFSEIIASAILQSISIGISNVEHFEEIAILHKGIGCDRISDITANILKSYFIKYTQETCSKLNIPMTSVIVKNSEFDFDFLRWENKKIELPMNKYFNRPIILVPREFLRELPTINVGGFKDYIWDNESEKLRTDLNYEVKSKINKTEVIKIAKDNYFLVRDYIKYVEDYVEPISYDLDSDKSGLYHWAQVTDSYVISNPLKSNIQNTDDLVKFVEKIIDKFKHFIEMNSGYELLWNNDNTHKYESASQSLFLGIVKNYCEANDIDISKEVNIGKGPVDFKFSKGYKIRLLTELKLAINSKFYNGLRTQLPEYLKAEKINAGIFLIIVFFENELKKVEKIKEIINEVEKSNNVSLKVEMIDARADNKISASKLK